MLWRDRPLESKLLAAFVALSVGGLALACKDDKKGDAADPAATDDPTVTTGDQPGGTGGGTGKGGTGGGGTTTGGTTGDDDGPSCVAPATVYHLAYENNGYDLRYGTNECGSWVFETVAAGAGLTPALAIDSTGRVAIAAGDNSARRVVLFRRQDDKTWTSEVVVDEFTSARDIAIAFDKNDQPHVAYVDSSDDDVNHAVKDGSGWTATKIETVQAANISMAVDASSTAHVVYTTGSGNTANLKYSAVTSSGHVEADIDSTSNGAGADRTDIVIDANGHPQVIFRMKDGLLYVSTNATGPWLRTSVDGGVNLGTNPTLAMDDDGELYATYFKSSFAAKKTTGGSWGPFAEPPQATGNDAISTDVATDAANELHMLQSKFNAGLGRSIIALSSTTNGAWGTPEVLGVDDISGTRRFSFAIAGRPGNNSRP